MPKPSRYSFYILALLLPLQTIFSQFLTIKLGFPVWLNFWKEILVVVIILELGWGILLQLFHKPKNLKITFLNLLPLILITLATAIVTINSVLFGKFFGSVYIIGFRFELFWLWFFAVTATWLNLNKNPGLQTQIKHLQKFILAGLGIVFLISIFSISIGQEKFLTLIGFGQKSTSELVISAPTCHVIDFGSTDCRFSGTFSTPNHLAGYLLLILPVLIINLNNSYKISKKDPKIIFYSLFLAFSIVLIAMSAARYALLALAIWLIISAVRLIKIRETVSKSIFIALLLIPVAITIYPIYYGFKTKDPNFSIQSQYLPTVITKQSSTVEHYRNTMASLNILTESPQKIWTGLGLGNSGPAAKREYQNLETRNLLFQDYFPLSYRWYILPDRITIPESWYIQVLLNGGILYFVLYISLLFYPLKNLWTRFKTKTSEIDFNQLQIFMAFFAIISGNLFLHLWENQTISLYWTILWLWSYSLKQPTDQTVSLEMPLK